MKKGFFSSEEVDLSAFSRRLTCRNCNLSRQCQSPKMQPTGSGELPILFLAEAPGKAEDLRNEQLVGKAGRVVRDALSTLDIDLDDCRKINAVNCRPPNNRTPTSDEIAACRPMLMEEVQSNLPEVIVPMGNAALESLLGERHSGLSINKYRGWDIPDPFYGCWIVPTFHPSYVMREGSDVVDLIFQRDLLKAIQKLEEKPSPLDIEDVAIDCITDTEEAAEAIAELHGHAELVAFDYETTALKPHRADHHIYTASIATEEECISFVVDGDGDVMDALVELLEDYEVKKIGANISFEELWTREVLGTEVNGWVWDTVQAAHILDHRSGITGVKFQAYVRLGVEDWGEEISPYLKAKSANEANRIRKVPIDKVLRYGGIDSLVEYELAMLQMEEMEC